MRRGQSILIHSGAGGVGLAAIQVARHLGAGEIYVTCGAEEKRRHLVDVEGVAAANIFSSRSDAFARGVVRATGGRGVDVVLNSLSGDLLDASWGCVAEGGCVVDVSRVDFLRRNRLQMRPFCRSTSFHGVDASQVMTHKVVAGEVMRILAELAAAGRVRPIRPMQKFGLDEVEAAFRLMQSGRSMGKLVVSRQAGDGCKMDVKINVQPSRKGDLLTLRAEATYVLIGCLGGIGRSITRSMFDRGARSFVMLSPSGDDRPSAKELVAFLRRNGADVTVIRGDVGRLQDVRAAMAAAPRGRPVRGLVHSAMVLRDAPFSASSPADFNAVAGPKVHGAHNLHVASLELADPQAVDFFMMLSSVSGVAGNYGQTAYAAGNTYLDALAAHRHGLGLAATALDLGFVEDVGWATENERLNERMAVMGVLAVQVKEAELLALVELEMKNSSDRQATAATAATAAAGVDDKQQRQHPTLGFQCPAQTIFGLTSTNSNPSKSYAVPRLRALLNSGNGSGSSSASLSQSGPAAALLQHLKSSAKGKDNGASLTAVTPLALDALLHKMSEFLLVPVDEIDAGRSPESLGVDSLVAVELRTWLRDSLGVAASTMDILKAASFRSLADTVAKRLVDKEGKK
jgi:acyl carrier protein/NADP-dependent 3-hydroxy acid dehydrogenase YdfG